MTLLIFIFSVLLRYATVSELESPDTPYIKRILRVSMNKTEVTRYNIYKSNIILLLTSPYMDCIQIEYQIYELVYMNLYIAPEYIPSMLGFLLLIFLGFFCFQLFFVCFFYVVFFLFFLFFCLYYFVYCCLSCCPVSFELCIVSPYQYTTIWYLQTFYNILHINRISRIIVTRHETPEASI